MQGGLSVRKIVISGVLGAIAILLGATRLGFIPVPSPAGDATIMHVPVIIGAILEGPLVGAIIGTIFGVFSFLQVGAPMFKDPLISILPRIPIGVVAFVAYAALRKRNEYAAMIASAVAGTLTNTLLVLGMAVLRGYLTTAVAGLVIGTLAPFEAAIAALVVVVVVSAWKRVESGRGKSKV